MTMLIDLLNVAALGLFLTSPVMMAVAALFAATSAASYRRRQETYMVAHFCISVAGYQILASFLAATVANILKNVN